MMIDPVSASPIRPLVPAGAPRPAGDAAQPGGFAADLRQQLEKVSRMQEEADRGVQDVLTGKSDNLTDVFTAARKAEVAFSLLMEIRNKLVDAYTELRQLRV